MVTASSIGEAFDDIWTLERACQILVTAWSTGQPLRVLSDEVAEKPRGAGKALPISRASILKK